MERKLRAFYRQRLYGPRTHLARILDFVALRLACFGASYIVFLFLLRSRPLALSMAVIITLALSIVLYLVARTRLEGFIKKESCRLRRRILLEELVLFPCPRFIRFVKSLARSLGYVRLKADQGWIQGTLGGRPAFIRALQRHPSESLGAQDVLDCFLKAQRLGRDQVLLICTSEPDKEAVGFSEKPELSGVRLLAGPALVDQAEAAGLLPPESVVEKLVEAEMLRQGRLFESVKKSALAPLKFRRYLACAAILSGMGVFYGFNAFYFVFAGVCLALAAMSVVMARRRKKAESGS